MKGMHHAWHIAQQGKYEIEPKLAAQTDSTKHTERWQYSSKDYLHGTRNHGSHGAFLSEGRCHTCRLIPGQSTGFPPRMKCKFYTKAPGCPRHRTHGKHRTSVL